MFKFQAGDKVQIDGCSVVYSVVHAGSNEWVTLARPEHQEWYGPAQVSRLTKI